MKPHSLLLLGCLSLSPIALADDDEKSKDNKDEAALRYDEDKGLIWDVKKDVSFRLNGIAQIEGVADEDTLAGQDAPVLPRRLRLSLRGKVTDYVDMRLAVDFAPLIDVGNNANNDDDGEFLTNAYLQGNINKDLYVRAGYFKTPFGRQRINSSSALLMPNRAVATGQFTFDRGVGGIVGGDLKKKLFEYQAGVTADVVLANQLNVSAVPVGVVRLVLNPLGSLDADDGALKPVDELHVSFGLNAGIPFQSNNDTGNPVFGIDAAVEMGRLFGTAEGFVRPRLLEAEVDVNGVNVDQEIGGTQLQGGGFLQAGAIVIPKRLQAGARFGVVGFDPDFSDGNNNGNFNTQGLKTDTSAVLNGFIFERRLMIQAMYSFETEQDDNQADGLKQENIFTLQLQGAL